MSIPDALTETRFRVLLVDDDPNFTDDLVRFLDERYELAVVHDGPAALAHIADSMPDVVLLDLDLGRHQEEGFALLEEIKAAALAPEVVMLTGRSDAEAVVQAIKSGAFHYLIKPPVVSELINLVDLAGARARDGRRLAALTSQVRRLGGELVVRDAAMQRVMADLDRVGPTDATVMIVGESGTGKELIARHVHELSNRSAGPVVAINCGAISEQLIESELFGHVRGAFTGAECDRDGCFAQARGGTIFLDEIGYAPTSLQVKLLRVLESREYQRVGSAKIERADVRVVTASSRDLREAVDAGEFREELYFRLNVFRVALPPLRERPGDIMALAEHFLAMFAAQTGRRDLHFTSSAGEYLRQHPWPGNVRELRNLIERAVILSSSEAISVQQLAADDASLPAALPLYDDAKAVVVERFKRVYVPRVLHEAGGNVTKAAKLAGLARATLSRMMGELGLRE